MIEITLSALALFGAVVITMLFCVTLFLLLTRWALGKHKRTVTELAECQQNRKMVLEMFLKERQKVAGRIDIDGDSKLKVVAMDMGIHSLVIEQPKEGGEEWKVVSILAFKSVEEVERLQGELDGVAEALEKDEEEES